MNAQSVISYALNPSGPGFMVYVSTGTGALMPMDSREVAEFQRQGVEVEPLCVGRGGSCMVRDGRPAVVTVAYEGKGYCEYHSPVSAPAPSAPSAPVSAPSGGVSLAKSTDGAAPVARVVAGRMSDARYRSVSGTYTRARVEANDLTALSRAFGNYARRASAERLRAAYAY
jgi:hypothetical protein